jgi:putative ABC transport system permease protein
MTILYRIRALARWLFKRDEIERALDSDLADYIERSAAEKVRAGMSEAQARRAARIELGGVEQTKESVRATLSFAPIDNTFADMSYALRTLSRQKTFTAVAVLTLALGIGVNVAIFSLTDQTLLRPLPVPESDRLVNLTDPGKIIGIQMGPQGNPETYTAVRTSASGGYETVFSYPMFRDLQRQQQPFVDIAAHTFFDATLSSGDTPGLATIAIVSGSYFPVLGLAPALGRLLGPEDDRVDGEAQSVVLSHAYWERQFGGDPNVLGRTMLVGNVPLTIVGVAPPGFNGTAVGTRASAFVPITVSFSTGLEGFAAAVAIPNHIHRNLYWVHLFARLKSGVTREQAAAAVNPLYGAILNDIEAPFLADVDAEQREALSTRPLVLEAGARGQTSSQILSPARSGLTLVWAASGLVLVLCCANVGGLMLVRATTRTGEMAVRGSMGATRGRLASLLLAESLVLALPAVLMSLPVAWLILRGASWVPGLSTAGSGATLSVTAAFVALGVAVAAALGVGLLPVRRLIWTDLAKTLQASSGRQTTAKGVARFRAALATAQVALAMALLATMSSFAQSLANVARLDLGFDIDSVVMFSVPPRGGLATSVSSLPRLAEALEEIPGVSAVAWSNYRPLLSLQGAATKDATVEGMTVEPFPVSQDIVSGDFAQVFDIDLVAGREFRDTDNSAGSSRLRAIVNQRFAEQLGLDPDATVGRTVKAIYTFEIVGVVEDVRIGKITNAIEPHMFVLAASGMVFTGATTFYVRSELPPADVMSAIRTAINRVDPTTPIADLQPMEQQFRETIAAERFFAQTSTVFAVLATALAALGLYGVLAYSVAQRAREIALRFALGARPTRIRWMVLRQVALMAVIGVGLGTIAAWGLGRAAQNVVFGVEPGSLLALVSAAALLMVIMLGAAYIPARRASRVDPMTVLRYE